MLTMTRKILKGLPMIAKTSGSRFFPRYILRTDDQGKHGQEGRDQAEQNDRLEGGSG